MTATPVPTTDPTRCHLCGSPDVTVDRYGCVACATCREASLLLSGAIVAELRALKATHAGMQQREAEMAAAAVDALEAQVAAEQRESA